MSIWYCDMHGLTGPMPCCSQARHTTLKELGAKTFASDFSDACQRIAALQSQVAALSDDLSACQSALEKRGWQPIETAPKERDILVSTKNGVMYVACLDCERDDSDFPWTGRFAFTHWQPLPSPPEEAKPVPQKGDDHGAT